MHSKPQGHVQVLLNMLEFGMNPQEALDALRVCIGPTKGISVETDEVFLEEGVDDSTVHTLEAMGHHVIVLKGFSRSQFGRGQIVQQVLRAHRNGQQRRVLLGGSDPRADGCAFGY